MISYSQLRSWRNICEYLDGRWYKFAFTSDILNQKGILPGILEKEHRKALWDLYLIQFVRWGYHPVLNYTRSKSVCREFKYDSGWILVSEWQYKVDYLEKVVLFDREPSIKPWEPSLRRRMEARQRRQEAIELKNRLMQLGEKERRSQCAELGICPRCFSSIPALMLDCVNCGLTIE